MKNGTASNLELLIPLAVATRLCGFEVQRWTRARSSGKRGSNEAFGLFVDATGLVTSLTYYVWLILVGIRLGIVQALSVFVGVTVIITMITLTTGADRLWKWMLGLLGVWPLTIALFLVV